MKVKEEREEKEIKWGMIKKGKVIEKIKKGEIIKYENEEKKKG